MKKKKKKKRVCRCKADDGVGDGKRDRDSEDRNSWSCKDGPSRGGIPLPIFSEWWLAKEKFSTIEAFIIFSFPGVTCQGCNGLSIKYQGKRLKRDAGIKMSSHQVIQSLWMHLVCVSFCMLWAFLGVVF
ncbi:ABC transporter A family member 1 [Camellia lanceoleosa]|nr:ABC transporter A family member 1 [Camellia lanceoleosa]